MNVIFLPFPFSAFKFIVDTGLEYYMQLVLDTFKKRGGKEAKKVREAVNRHLTPALLDWLHWTDGFYKVGLHYGNEVLNWVDKTAWSWPEPINNADYVALKCYSGEYDYISKEKA